MPKKFTQAEIIALTEKRKRCVGCRDNYYNGNSTTGFCWRLPDATLVLKKEIHIDQIPPFKNPPRPFFNCYHKPHYQYHDPD